MTSKKMYIAILCFVILQHLVAQSADGIPSRFSYFSTYPTVSGQQRSPAVCFELYQSGRYRIMRSRNGARETLGGTLNLDQLGAFAVLANGLDFDNNQGVFLIRQGSESFEGEGWRWFNHQKRLRYMWVNPDHQRPFPKSAVNIINWLQNFTAQVASRIVVPEVGGDPICPSDTIVSGIQ